MLFGGAVQRLDLGRGGRFAQGGICAVNVARHTGGQLLWGSVNNDPPVAHPHTPGPLADPHGQAVQMCQDLEAIV